MRSSILAALEDPNRAWIILLVGLILVFRECTAPGRVLPGVLGAVAICVSIYALFQHPWQVEALLSITAGIGMLFLQLLRRYLWIPTITGAILITAGIHLLTVPRIKLGLALLAIPLSGITVFLLKTAVAARRNKVSVQ
jgi:membrane-bound serine protease (ClpP class)